MPDPPTPLATLLEQARLHALRPEQRLQLMLRNRRAPRSWLEAARDDYQSALDNINAAIQQLPPPKEKT